MEPSATVPVSNHVETSPVEVEEILDCDDEADKEQVEELVDNEELVGRNLKALYENGWFGGKMKYLNEKICRYFVLYKDKSSHLIDIFDIDGVKMILM